MDFIESVGKAGDVSVRGVHQRGDERGAGEVRVDSKRGRAVGIEEQDESLQGEAVGVERDELLVADVHVRIPKSRFVPPRSVSRRKLHSL